MRKIQTTLLLFLLGTWTAWAQVSIKPGIPLIVPGTGLGWEVQELKLVVQVDEPGEVEIRLYSPGFDPRDYRSSKELGDERYDGGRGRLLAVYQLLRGDEVLAEQEYGIEPHRWVTFFQGPLEAGEYLLVSKFLGNGKNAVVYKLIAHSGKARLTVAPSSMQTYNVVRGGWQTPFVVEIPEPSPGVRAGIYDGDGPRELNIRVRGPEGEHYPPVSGNYEWTEVPLDRVGRYAFSFRIPKGARQYTNTVGFRLFLGTIKVELVDEEGRPVPGAGYRVLGEYVREVVPILPSGWELLRTEVKDGRLVSKDRAVFGLGRGFVRFVLRRKVELGSLKLSAVARCGDWSHPVSLRVRVGEHVLAVPEGGLEVPLEPGTYRVSPDPLPGATLEAPAKVQVRAGAVTEVRLHVRPEIRLTFEKLPATVPLGKTQPVTVRATTKFPGEVPLTVSLTALEPFYLLGPSSAHGIVRPDSPLRLVSSVVAKRPGEGRLIARSSPCAARAEAELVASRPPKPALELDRTLSSTTLFPGEKLEVCLEVRSTGTAPVSYWIMEQIPSWLETEHPPRFSGALKPGETRRHCYQARVLYGDSAEGLLRAVVESDAGKRVEETRVRRSLLGLKKGVDPESLSLGQPAEFWIRVTNPLMRPIHVELAELPDRGLGFQPWRKTVDLGPREDRVFRFSATPVRSGTLENEVRAYIRGTLAAHPAKAKLRVAPPPRVERLSEVHLAFSVQEGTGEALILRHAPPSKARYVPGSSRLNGKPFEDPRRDPQGRLYWRIPFQTQGDLRYVLRHTAPLGPLPKPELTLLTSEGEVVLQGGVRLEDFEEAKPLRKRLFEGAMVRVTREAFLRLRLPKPATIEREGEVLATLEVPGEFTLPLEPGENRFLVRSGEGVQPLVVYRSGPPARVRLERVRAVADGRTPLVYRLRFEDEEGNPAAVERATISSDPEPLDPDADPRVSGYQVPVESGVATLRLRPTPTPRAVTVRVLMGERVETLSDYVQGGKTSLYLAQGSVTVRVAPGLSWGGLARGYLEAPLGEGYLQAAMDLTYTDGALYRGLSRPEDPTGRFPLLGSGEESRRPLASDDGVAFRYDRGAFSLGYGRISRGYSALYLEKRGAFSLSAHVGLVARDRVVERMIPDGSRVYALSRPARPGSEAVYLESGGERRRLVAFRDYSFDALNGMLYLAQPLWPTDAAFNPVTLVVEYAPLEAPRDRLAYGVSAGYREGPFSLRAFFDTTDAGVDWTWGLEAGYRLRAFGARLAYRNESGRSKFRLTADGRVEGYEASANLTYDQTVSGRARVAAELTKHDRLALEHEGSRGLNETRVLYERRWVEAWSGGLGLGYRWNNQRVAAVARLGYESERSKFTLTHSQPFAAPARTSLHAQEALDENLTFKLDLAYDWNQGLGGVLGLDQTLGSANLSLTYRLPGASGEGNRARFGIRAPFALGAHWSLDVYAGASYDFDDSTRLLGAGMGLRYRDERLAGTLGVDGSIGDRGKKLALRAGLAGTLDDRQVLSADANFQLLPEHRGRFTLAYAFRGETLQALTYHRFRTYPAPELEGEAALAWHPSLRWQLRPSAAYRLRLADPEGNTYQVGLGANYYFSSRLGIGGGVYYIWQPARDRSGCSFGVEGSYRLADPVWLNLGYTFGGFEGITLEARPGLYLRVDLFGGSEAP